MGKGRSSFNRDAFSLGLGTAGGQIVSILAAPVITRLFAPEAFGIAGVFVAVAAILSVFSCLRYEMAIVLPAEDTDAGNLFVVCLAISVLMTLIVTVAVYFLATDASRLVQTPEIEALSWFLPAFVFLAGCLSALGFWTNRLKRFGTLSASRFGGQLSNTGSGVAAGLTGFNSGASLVMANMIGQVTTLFWLTSATARSSGNSPFKGFRYSRAKQLMIEYRKFPIFSTWSGLLNTLSWHMPVLLLGGLFSPAVAGFYVLGLRLLQMPVRLIGESVAEVFHQRAASARLDGTLASLIEGIFQRLLVISLGPLMVLLLIGGDLFSVVFGTSWGTAGLFCQILVPMILLQFLSSPLSRLWGVMGLQGQGLITQLLHFFTRLTAVVIGAVYEDAVLAIILFSISGTLVYGSLLIRLLLYSGTPLMPLLHFKIREFVTLLPFLTVILVAGIFIEQPVYVAVIGLSVLVVYWMIRWNDLKDLLTSDPGRLA